MRVLIWNLETLGNSFVGSYSDDNCATVSNNLIAAVALQYNAQVIVIQEVMGFMGYIRMNDVRNILANIQPIGWSMDTLPGAFIDYNHNQTLFNQFFINPLNGDLGFTQQSHNEAYGVIWQGNSLGQVASNMSDRATSADPNITGNCYIELIYQGHDPSPMASGAPYFSYGHTNTLNFPIPNCANISGDLYKDRNILNFYNARRPCRINLNLGGMIGNVPCVVYHTPASSYANVYGAIAGLNSQCISALGNARWVYGGDFNLVNNGPQLDTRNRGLAFTQVRTNIDNQGNSSSSVVHYQNINGWRGPNYKTDSRDYGLMRNAGINSTIEVLDVVNDWAVDLIYGIGNNIGANYIRQQAANLLVNDQIAIMIATFNFATNNLAYNYVNYNLAGIWNDFRNNNINQQKVWILTSFLYSYLVSDHLPVLIDYQ